MFERMNPEGNRIISENVSRITPYIRNLEKIKVLDIGCGPGEFLSDFYNELSDRIVSMIGVDSENEEKGCSGELDIFDGNFEFHHNSTIDAKQIPDRVVQMIKADGPSFLKTLSEKQDVIVLSNFLHFFDESSRMEIVKDALDKLTDDGVVFISVRFDKDEKNYPPFPFSFDEIPLYKKLSPIKDFDQTETHYHFLLEKNIQGQEEFEKIIACLASQHSTDF